MSCFITLRCCIYSANKFKLPTIVGILTFMSRLNLVFSCVEHETSLYPNQVFISYF